MASSWTAIANSALIKLGASLITSIELDQTKEAKLCRERYEDVRDIVLRMYPWNCAVKRIQLAPSSTAPAFDYASEFILPSDCVRIYQIFPEGDYVIEGRSILSDETLLDVKYIKRITDPTELDALLGEAISYYLAYDICFAMIQNDGPRQTLFQAFEQTLRRAKHIDSSEDGRKSLQPNFFLEARSGGGAYIPSNR